MLTLVGVYILSSRQMKKNAVREGATAVIRHRSSQAVEDEHGLTVGGVEGLAAQAEVDTEMALAEPSARRDVAAAAEPDECPELIVDEEPQHARNGAAHVASPSAAAIGGSRFSLPGVGTGGSIGAALDGVNETPRHHRVGSMPSQHGHLSRPGTGDRAQSRFARRYSMMMDPEAQLVGGAYVASDSLQAAAPHSSRRSTAGAQPPVGSPTAEHNRKRSTWAAGRGSIWEAGMAILGAEPIAPVDGQDI